VIAPSVVWRGRGRRDSSLAARRLCLGVHYPGDVLTGQVIALLSAIPVLLRCGTR
jgi:membrane-associated phospholipid phosphatase